MNVNTRLDELSALHRLTEAQRGQLAELLRLVATDPHTPSTVVVPERAVDVHLADSLIALDDSQLRTATTVADLGAGAGFPGLPLAIALPDVHCYLVESRAPKCAFLEQAVDLLGLANATVVHNRVELWQDKLATLDLVTARALAPLGILLEYAAPLLRIGGRLVAWKGRREQVEEGAGQKVAQLLGMELESVRAVKPFPAAEYHHLHTYRKLHSTPDRFPRRPGLARKRPLA